ncbi:MAG TPA: ATP-binding cassette domain-containing protein [Vicinamibacterales bacterium]|jgi:ABC-type sulfate/molybdate transport systems ATPase subunit|nr:ATP-binding cassette domain-containing protein [Vicinamibacterales bacterium]
MSSNDVLLRLRGVSKDYRSLRPLRIAELDLPPGRSLALLGFDQTMAEVLVDLITGAILPDSGEIVAFGQHTSSIADPGSWLSTLDQFGLFTDRAVLVEQFTVEQNLALPLSITVEDMTPEIRARVAELASEIGLANELRRQAGVLGPALRARIRLGRALAIAPRVLVAEHPNATLSAQEASALGTDMARIIETRGIASIVLTADESFARAVSKEILVLEPATGALKPASSWRRWFS